MKLALKREKDHPGDALPIYKRQVKAHILLATSGNYTEAVKMVQKVQKTMERTGQHKEFVDYIQTIKKEYGLKRNLMKLLNDKVHM